jgi:hypothetical protein
VENERRLEAVERLADRVRRFASKREMRLVSGT